MKYLVDTNIWLEVLLGQERAAEARSFFEQVDSTELALSEFSLYSLAVILTTRFKKHQLLRDFINDTLYESGVTRLQVGWEGLVEILDIQDKYTLDFDDAYQYVVAAKNDLVLVSFDPVFERTLRKYKTPSEITASLVS